MANGSFQATNYAGTAAGIQEAVDALEASGGEIKIGPGTYAFGTASLIIQGNDIRIRGSGNRSTKLTYTGTGDFIVFGADDGVHSGVADAYNGLAQRCVLEELQIEGPGSATAARGVVDWEGGNQVFRGLTINAWGTGYFGIGADVSHFENCLIGANATGAHLASRCDQNQFTNCYFYNNTAASILIEYAQNTRIIGGQFVFNLYDIIVDAPASPTGGGDIRTDCGLYVAGTWFESDSSGTTSHIYLGRNGTSGRLTIGVSINGCFVLAVNSGCLVEVDAASFIHVTDTFQCGSNFGTSLIKVNSVSGVFPAITSKENRTTGGVIYGGAAGTGSALSYEMGETATKAVGYATPLTVNMAGVGSVIEIGNLTGDIAINAPTNPIRGMLRTWRFLQDGTGGRAVTWNAVFKQAWSDTGNTLNKRSTITFYYDGTNWVQVGAQSPYV